MYIWWISGWASRPRCKPGAGILRRTVIKTHLRNGLRWLSSSVFAPYSTYNALGNWGREWCTKPRQEVALKSRYVFVRPGREEPWEERCRWCRALVVLSQLEKFWSRTFFISSSDRCLHCLESFMGHIYMLLLCEFVVSGEDEFALLSRTLATLLRVLSNSASVTSFIRLLDHLALSVWM